MAPPGAGKTTRVPPALLEVFPQGEILCLCPRRLAAKLAATRVAAERGERVGATVGFTVRFENASGPQTRVRYVTTGVLLRTIQEQPDLPSVACVIFDEVHERHLDSDLLLALVTRLKKPFVVMSATLDHARLERYLDAPVVLSEGRSFAVEVVHAAREDSRPVAARVVTALAQTTGDTLVFLPGVADIERCLRASQRLEIDGFALHARLEPKAIARALSPTSRRRVIFATNIAESSVTLDGIETVIDSGLHKVASLDPFSGLTKLELTEIPRDSAVQRTGRAGRQGPGRCLRLYTEASFKRRPTHQTPEIQRVDLAPLVLTLAAAGVRGADELSWLDAPEPRRLEAATEVLIGLGALTTDGQLTRLGSQLAVLPLHPRLARLVLDGGELGHLAAALLSEGVRVPDGLLEGPCDVLALIDALRSGQLSHLRKRIGRVASQLKQATRRSRSASARSASAPLASDPRETLRRGLLTAFSDRVAKRRSQRPGYYQLADGQELRLHPRSVVHDSEFVVCVLTSASFGSIEAACAIEPDWLLDLPTAETDLNERIAVSWDDERQRVTADAQVRFRNLVLENRPVEARGLSETDALIQKRVRSAGLARFADVKALNLLVGRRRVAHQADASIPPLDDEAVRAVLDELCVGCVSIKEVKNADLLAHLRQQLSWDQKTRLESLAPERVKLAGGRWARVRYPTEGPPRVSAPIQHFLGMRTGPVLAGGKVRVLLELLAPNRRPAQLTDDLAGFWERTWPQVRKELRGRYPKHAWPEDPTR